MANNVWTELLERIETKVNRHSFNTWFSPTVFVEDTGDRVTVRVPSELCRNWLTKHYSGVITEATAEVHRSGVKVAFVIDAEVGTVTERPPHPAAETPAPPAETPAATTPPPSQTPAAETRGLNPRYTFDTFVVGSSNQFAHAAAVAVGEAPSRSYNPLYLYGGVGLGKTHLMHAIGHYILGQMPALKLTYISSERFMNEMINAVRYGRTLDFRERYRKLDVLMVDDVQFLSGKEGTQTEFFHTFNSLYDAQKQIVISSDCPPHEIREIEERLRSRFEWGLIADIQPPDLETKVAILKKKAEAEAVPLPDDVALYIASGIKSNVRELEGSLIRLIAYASLTGSPVSLPLAQEVLRNILHRDEQRVSIDMVQKFIANYYRLKLADIKGRNSSKAVAGPRQVAMFLCRTLTDASLPQIGKSFGRDHSTVVHSIRKVEGQCKTDREFHNLINSFIETFR